MYIGDLHIHSRYSRATSRDLTPESLDFWARRKGIHLIGTGDFTHPAWREELKEKLKPAEEGLYVLDPDLRRGEDVPGSSVPRFVISGEISSIYKKNGRVRKVHSLILLPGLEEAEALSKKLETIGNIHSDGRPILGLDCRDLLEITLEICPRAIYIPAHIWTPHFSLFGAFSGFDRIEECFEDMTPYIHALETGLSSDPPMNWRLSALDPYFLVSNSDAHSPSKLGREANLLDIEMSYEGLYQALQTGKGLEGTIEFFPEEGKYHYDGHRKCHVCVSPKEAEALGNRCPVCKKKLTIGVDHRVEQLADRKELFRPEHARRFESLVPLPEVIAAATGHGAASTKVQSLYENMMWKLGTEFEILRNVPVEEIRSQFGPMIGEGIRRLRDGRVKRLPGFDGEYGVIRLFEPWEIEEMEGQMNLFSLFGMEGEIQGQEKETEKAELVSDSRILRGESSFGTAVQRESAAGAIGQSLNLSQQQAVRSLARTTAVAAGPGTGKTRTLVERILYMIQEQRISPSEITAVTFTNRAAGEMEKRIHSRLSGKRGLKQMKIGTFHSICYRMLKDMGLEAVLLQESERLEIAEQVIGELGLKWKPSELLEEISRRKTGEERAEEESQDQTLCACRLYQERLEALNGMDYDDILLKAVKALEEGKMDEKPFRYLLVDEFQDVSPLQYRLIRLMNRRGRQLFVIGDPDQSIYGFRGSDARIFERLSQDEPELVLIRLEENYRSSGRIVHAARELIGHNPGPERGLWTDREPGLMIRLVSAGSEMSEAIFAAKEINRMVGGIDMLDAQEGFGPLEERKTRSFGDIAVIYRTHRQGELLERCLKQEGIPYIVAGREEFLQADSVRASLCFFSCLAGKESPLTRPLCRKLLWKDRKPEDGEWERLTADFLPLYQKQKPGKFLEAWVQRMGFQEDGPMEKFCSMAPFYRTMKEMVEAVQYGGESDLKRCGQKTYASGTVTLTTIHGAKGLEFPAVILFGARKGLIPLETKRGKMDEEEERRLFFVGITRAMEELVITSSGQPSAFLDELPKEDTASEQTGRRGKQEQEHQMSLFELDPSFGE